jgi:hypothetical protein
MAGRDGLKLLLLRMVGRFGAAINLRAGLSPPSKHRHARLRVLRKYRCGTQECGRYGEQPTTPLPSRRGYGRAGWAQAAVVKDGRALLTAMNRRAG